MAKLCCRSGIVHRVDRMTTPWRGAHGEPITTFDLAGIPVRYGGRPSLGVGDVITVVGHDSVHGMQARALRNESTDVRYAPNPWPIGAVGVALLAVVAPLLGFPAAFGVVPLGGAALLRAFHHYRVGWLLDAQPSRHGSSIRAPLHSMDRESRT